MPDPSQPAPSPALDWTDDGAPIDRASGDVYFSRDDGRAECVHVFHGGCGLPEAWRGRPAFAIGELGFGFGLNFLETWRAWSADPERSGTLDYLSVERAPPRPADMARALAPWPDLAPLAEALRADWPPAPGWSVRRFGPLTLRLGVGEAPELLAGSPPGGPEQRDAWFLDGFAPARNPDMWGDALLAAVARRTAPGGRLATFTAASAVRRGLSAAGLTAEKHPGFGRKREMLQARKPLTRG